VRPGCRTFVKHVAVTAATAPFGQLVRAAEQRAARSATRSAVDGPVSFREVNKQAPPFRRFASCRPLFFFLQRDGLRGKDEKVQAHDARLPSPQDRRPLAPVEGVVLVLLRVFNPPFFCSPLGKAHPVVDHGQAQEGRPQPPRPYLRVLQGRRPQAKVPPHRL